VALESGIVGFVVEAPSVRRFGRFAFGAARFLVRLKSSLDTRILV
jgi:hypothetical protein